MASGTIHNPSDIIYFDHQFNNIAISAGVIGTRGAQVTAVALPESGKYRLINVFPVYVGNSAEYIVNPFYYDGTIYCNFYRASTSASNASATIRAVYKAK